MAETPTFILVRCSKCGAVIGRMVPRLGPTGETVKLLADGWEIGEGERECRDCRTVFYFKPPEKGWTELVSKKNGGRMPQIAQLSGVNAATNVATV